MNHVNGGVRASGAIAPVVPDELLALTTEALAFVSRDRAEGMARQGLAGVPLSNSNEQSVLARSLALELALSVQAAVYLHDLIALAFATETSAFQVTEIYRSTHSSRRRSATNSFQVGLARGNNPQSSTRCGRRGT
jgi:hypothetical protein